MLIPGSLDGADEKGERDKNVFYGLVADNGEKEYNNPLKITNYDSIKINKIINEYESGKIQCNYYDNVKITIKE